MKIEARDKALECKAVNRGLLNIFVINPRLKFLLIDHKYRSNIGIIENYSKQKIQNDVIELIRCLVP